MTDVTDPQKLLEQAGKEIGYLKRTMGRMEKRLERQEKLDDMNRYQAKWAIKQVEDARRQAEQANHAKTEFLANMSHEIRTPLNIVLGMGEVLAATELDDSQKQYLQSLRLSGEHLLKLLNDILEFSRIESGSVEVDPVPFDLKQLLVDIEAMGAHMASEKGLEFHLEYDRSLELNRVGDSRKIKQVLLNLLGNGVKFTDRGKVTLSVTGLPEGEGENLVFTVSDTGIGIPRGEQELIFERFIQIEDNTFKTKGGVGLGLAICEGLVQAMGGRISLVSEVDRGSSFSVTIRLPFTEESERISWETDIEDSSFKFNNIHALVVDDINLNFEVIKNYFKGLPVRLDYADNGRKAVELFAKGAYSVVLMDIRMPVMGGLDAVRNIRLLEGQKKIDSTPIVAMTAHAFSEQRKNYLEAGFDDVLIKPFSRWDLLTVLMRHVKQDVPAVQQNMDPGKQISPDNDSLVGLETLLPKVLDTIAKEISVIKSALSENDQKKLKQTSHAVKGLAGFYGLTQLSDLVEHLEGSAKRREYRTACALADALGCHVSELKRRGQKQAARPTNPNGHLF